MVPGMTEGCGKDLWVEDLSVGEISVAENLLGVEVKREVVRSIIYSSLKVFLFIIIIFISRSVAVTRTHELSVNYQRQRASQKDTWAATSFLTPSLFRWIHPLYLRVCPSVWWSCFFKCQKSLWKSSGQFDFAECYDDLGAGLMYGVCPCQTAVALKKPIYAGKSTRIQQKTP